MSFMEIPATVSHFLQKTLVCRGRGGGGGQKPQAPIVDLRAGKCEKGGREREGGEGTQRFVNQKRSDKIFPNFVISHDGHFGLGGGPGGGGGYPLSSDGVQPF